YFKRAEGNERFGGTLHSGEGPLNVADLVSPNPLNEMFLAACAALQLARNRDFNGLTQEGVGYYQVTQKHGERWSAARAYLTPQVRLRRNLLIATGTRAVRIAFSGRRATGLICRRGRSAQRIAAGKPVILAAGAFQSPQLLMLSGVGPGAELRRPAIPVLHDLPGVGANLQDHVDFTLLYRANSPHLFGLTARGLARLPREILRWRRERTGLM